MKYVLIILGAIAALILIVVVIGALLPKEHHVTRAARFRQPPEVIWAALTNYREFPSWRSNVKRAESLQTGSQFPAWREYDGHGDSIPMRVTILEPPRRLVTEIADPKLPFGGTWTTVITPGEGGSEVRITEDGEVRNPVFRIVSRFIIGLNATIDTYLHDLGKKFDENVQVGN